MVIKEVISKLRECDDFHNRCDYLLDHSEITYLLEYIDRISKAIEYIKYNATSNYFDETANMFRREMDLLDILGDDNNG